MIRWAPDTCHCIIIAPRPSIRGTFEKRCRLHKRTNSTLVVYDHNKDNRITASEETTIRISDPELPQSVIDSFRRFFPFLANPLSDLSITRATEAGNKRKRDLKESTRL